MIICPNCGSTNDENTKVCRKCGALLPVSTKAPRLRVPFSKKDKESEKKETSNKPPSKSETNTFTPAETKFFNSKGEKEEKNNLNLQEIPMSGNGIENNSETSDEIQPLNQNRWADLEEIEPSPFDGSIFSKDPVSGTSTPQSKPKSQSKPLTPVKPSQELSKKKKQQADEVQGRRKQLEEDMREVLRFLSEKLQIPQTEEIITDDEEIEEEEAPKKEIKPESLTEILKKLLNIDINVEASALINRDGTILASAISDRISDSLFATIGQNLSMMGEDIIDGLSAGSLQSISVRGTEGILDLAPIDSENPNLSKMLLIIFSNPKVKSGVINIATNLVRKQVKEYLGIK
ncbi:MAG: zinc-ribbon domain-containing protein [Promethearchaeota archaeon]|nr:MAG: zinc-ribbon domain-containing protein [Candidatus Lokiarchaeota archaeon]